MKVTNRRGKKGPILNLKKSCIINGLTVWKARHIFIPGHTQNPIITRKNPVVLWEAMIATLPKVKKNRATPLLSDRSRLAFWPAVFISKNATPPKNAAEPRDRPCLPADLEPPKGSGSGLGLGSGRAWADVRDRSWPKVVVVVVVVVVFVVLSSQRHQQYTQCPSWF